MKLLGTKGIATRGTLLVAPGIATRSKKLPKASSANTTPWPTTKAGDSF